MESHALLIQARCHTVKTGKEHRGGECGAETKGEEDAILA